MKDMIAGRISGRTGGRMSARMSAQAKGFWFSVVFHACALALMAGLASGPRPHASKLLSLDISLGRPAAPQVQTSIPKPRHVVQRKEPLAPQKEPVAPVIEQAAPLEQTEESSEPAQTEATGMPASESETSSMPDSGFSIDLSGLRERVQRSISYPALARRMGWEGRVVVSFIICPDGSIRNVKIVESSGKPILDSNALDVVKRIDRFPTGGLISGAGESVVLPIVYRLDG